MGRKPSKKKRAENPELTQRWVHILTPLYMRGELNKSNMEEIAKLLGVAKATFYKYYQSKGDIVSDVVDLKIKELSAFEKKLFDENVPYRQRYFGAVELAAIGLAEISENFLLYLKSQFPDLWVKVDTFLEFASYKIQEFYAKGHESGFLREFNPKLSALVDKIFITALSDPQFLIDNELSLHESLREYFSIKSKGIFKNDS